MAEKELTPSFVHRLMAGPMGSAFLAGAIFLVVFMVAYAFIPANFYQSRDDGIITMSHARNLADYGVIGINPAAERVEGYSTPLQMVVYVIGYALFRLDYSLFGLLQTVLGTVLLGVVFGLFFRVRHPWGTGLAVAAAVCLALSSGFLEWHGSGMENPYTHGVILLVLWVSWTALARERVSASTVVVLFAASLVRSEFIGHVLPVLLLLGVYFFRRGGRWPAVARLALVPILWGLVQGARVWYFGDFFPNSAYAQSISVMGRLTALVTAPAEFWSTVWPVLAEVFRFHNGYFLLFLLPALYFLEWDKRRLIFVLVLVSLVSTTLLSLVIFGPSRLDDTRITTHLALLVVFWWCWLISNLRTGRRQMVTAGLLLVLGFAVRWATYQPPYYLCCSGPDFEHIRSEFRFLQEENELARATVANPDLGVMSYHKDFNVLDLGCLGNPVLARIQFQRDLVATYFFEFAAPDIIECHPTWMAAYPEIFEDPRFDRLYERIEKHHDPWFEAHGLTADIRFWVRRDIRPASDTPERRLLDDLQAELSLVRIQAELAACALSGAAPGRSLYVTRTAYRFLPEFRARGQQRALLDLFAVSPTARYDLAVLDAAGRRDWYGDAIAAVTEFHHHRARQGQGNAADDPSGLQRGKEERFSSSQP